MNLGREITTVCVGGPANGQALTSCSSEVQVMTAGPVQTLDGDELVGDMMAYATHENYHLERVQLAWSTGVCWVYHFWAHESVKGDPQGIFALMHPCDCYVERYALAASTKAPQAPTETINGQEIILN